MKTKRQWRLFSVIVLLLAAGWIAWTATWKVQPVQTAKYLPQKGFAAPDFELFSASGAAYRLSDLRGKVVVLNLWASWCPPCKSEMPALQSVYARYQTDDVVFLAINATWQDDRSAATAFSVTNGLTFPVLFDVDGSVSRLYQMQALPTTFWIDRDGIIRNVVVGGPLEDAYIEAQVLDLLQGGG
ncbi:MAG: TlpA family protein disulfide reductase [Chloroflexi bacterium]|nr:TlpA family protein disulfide reductase [Chloroflexota bacterium]